jgi:hypothetical protein
MRIVFFLKETLPVALVVHGATHDPPYTISTISKQCIEEQWQMARKEKAWQSIQTQTTQHVHNHLRDKVTDSAMFEIQQNEV